MDEFKLHMPLIQTLGDPGMKSRHWERISEIIGFSITPSDDMTLQKVIEFSLEEYVEKFEIVSDSASKENSLEMTLARMAAEWKDIEFGVSEHKDTGTYIIQSIDDIQILMDDQIIKTQTIKNSPYMMPFETEIL